MFNAQNNILSLEQFIEVSDYGNIGTATYLYKSAESRPSLSSKKSDSDDDNDENLNISDEKKGPRLPDSISNLNIAKSSINSNLFN